MIRSRTCIPSSLVIALVALINSCTAGLNGLSDSACSTAMIGTPAEAFVSVVWGRTQLGEKGKATATIRKVSVECLPIDNPAVENSSGKRAAYRSYQISATASVDYEINDDKWLQDAVIAPSDTIRFEAISENGVVLGAGTGTFNLIRGAAQGTETVSGSITELSDAEIRRVREVVARFTYGK